MIIVGAGLAGLIAANILREEVDNIYEAQPHLPNNHHALLRFRSSVVGDACGVPFQQVVVHKAIHASLNPVEDAARYSLKVLGRVDMRSIQKVETSGVRYIAPSDLIDRLARNVNGKIMFGKTFHDAYSQPLLERAHLDERETLPIISTIPMPDLMGELGYDVNRIKTKLPWRFEHVGGTVLRAELPPQVNMYATVYVPGSEIMAYRVSVTGRTLIVESSDVYSLDELETPEETLRRELKRAMWVLGLDYFSNEAAQNATIKRQQYAKIAPIPEEVRKDFIRWATEHHNVYSLGRFATWRPGLLLDDIVQDVRHIQRMIGGDMSLNYNWRKGA